MKPKKELPLLEKTHLVNCPHCGQVVELYLEGRQEAVISCDEHFRKFTPIQWMFHSRASNTKKYCHKEFLVKGIISEGRCPECLEHRRPKITLQITPLFSEFMVVQTVAPGA